MEQTLLLNLIGTLRREAEMLGYYDSLDRSDPLWVKQENKVNNAEKRLIAYLELNGVTK